MPDSLPIARVTRTKAEARMAYDRLSRWYDVLAGSSERKYTDRALEILAALPGESILEIGYGTGQALISLAKATGPTGKVTGIDLSPGMLSLARERVEKAGVSGWVHLDCGDAINLPYPEDSFQAILMSFTLELFDTPEIPRVLQECRRVLDPRGRIGIVAMDKGQSNLAVRLYEQAHQRFPTLLDCRPIYASQAVAEAGFQIHKQVGFSMWGLPGEIVIGRKSLA
jgi:ubiquinone/menaquinone biosynthesis C-methylase UbiE